MPSFVVRVSSPDSLGRAGDRRDVVVDAPDEETAARLGAGMVGQGTVHSVKAYKPKSKPKSNPKSKPKFREVNNGK